MPKQVFLRCGISDCCICHRARKGKPCEFCIEMLGCLSCLVVVGGLGNLYTCNCISASLLNFTISKPQPCDNIITSFLEFEWKSSTHRHLLGHSPHDQCISLSLFGTCVVIRPI